MALNYNLIQIIFGWPFVALSVFVSIVGVLFERPALVLLGAILIVPFCYNLSGTNTYAIFAFLLPVFQAGSAWAVKDENETWSWLLQMPTLGVVAWIVVIGLIS